jgi:hypothetical protein
VAYSGDREQKLMVAKISIKNNKRRVLKYEKTR